MQAAILAVEHCAASLGACERLWLREQQTASKPCPHRTRGREAGCKPAERQSAYECAIRPDRTLTFFLSEHARPVVASRSRAPVRASGSSAAETLDRSDAKPLLGSSKQRFEDCHPARGLPAVAFNSICIDNERMQTSLAQEGGLSPCHISPQALSRTEVTSTRGLLAVNAYDNDSYQNHKTKKGLRCSIRGMVGIFPHPPP